MIRRCIERVVDFQPGEFAPAVLSALYFFCLLFGYFILRPLRDAMGLEGGVDSLRALFLVTLGVMIVANIAFGFVASRLPRRVFVPLVYAAAVVCLGAFLVTFLTLGDHRSLLVGQVFYVWLSVFNLFAVTVFWGFMADIFRREQGKRLFGFIGVGGTAGAICGSAWTGALANALGEIGLFACSILLVGCAGALAVGLDRLAAEREMEASRDPQREQHAIGGASWEGIASVARSPYLLAIATYVGAFTILSTLIYFEKARIVESFVEGTAERTQILALIELAGQTLTILLQLFITGRLMKLLGVGTLLAAVPAVTILGFAALALSPALLVIAIFEATRRASNHALSKPARETLFTVVPRADKYKAKSFIDTFVYRGGDTVGTLADKAAAAFGLTVAWIAIPIAGAALALSFWLGRREELAPVHNTTTDPPIDRSSAAPLADAPQPMPASTP